MVLPKASITLFALFLSPFAYSTPAPLTRSSTAYPGFIHPSNGNCKDYIINSTVTYTQLQWSEPLYKNNYDVIKLLSKIAIQGKVPFSAFNGTQDVTKTFQVAGTFCKPKELKGEKESTVLVATHGAGFDRRSVASSIYPSSR